MQRTDQVHAVSQYKSPNPFMWFVAAQHKLYVTVNGLQHAPLAAFSGGGATTPLYEKHRREHNFLDEEGHHIYLSSRRDALDSRIGQVADHRGGALPLGMWTAVSEQHPEFRKPVHKIKPIFFLIPDHSTKAVWASRHAHRNWSTFTSMPRGIMEATAASSWDLMNVNS